MLYDCSFSFGNKNPGTSGSVQFIDLPDRGIYTLKVTAETEEGENAIIKRQFRIGLLHHSQKQKDSLLIVQVLSHGISNHVSCILSIEKPDVCTVHLINEGVSISGQTVKVEFSPTGGTQSTACILDPPQTGGNKFLPC